MSNTWVECEWCEMYEADMDGTMAEHLESCPAKPNLLDSGNMVLVNRVEVLEAMNAMHGLLQQLPCCIEDMVGTDGYNAIRRAFNQLRK